jgi:hypothetical protein
MHSESHTVGAEQVSQDTLAAFYKVPTFIYSYKRETDQLHRTSHWRTLKPSSDSNTFKYCCFVSEVLGGSLLITGGSFPVELREVLRIHTRRELT